jgi:pectinesterase
MLRRSLTTVFLLTSAIAGAALKPDAVVALDGSGNYTTIQEAISSAPMKTDPAAPRWVIAVKPGVYQERVYVQRERGHIHVVGENAATTILTFNLHGNLPGPDGKPIGTFRTPTLQIDGDGMIWENITVANSAGPVAQALALRADGDGLTFRHCRFLGWQDTILLNRGRQLFDDCYIEGHVDFIFGGASAYFSRCHIHALRDGYLTAASTAKDQAFGFVFADCRITGEPGVRTFLGRPWRDFAKTIFIRTDMSDVVQPAAWDNWNKPAAEKTTFYAEADSTGGGASSKTRAPWAKEMDSDFAASLTAERVLGADFEQPVPSSPARLRSIRIVLVGDSTVSDQTGWGRGFKKYLAPEALCSNAALNGRSSKSFRDEGHWAPALALHGDYYLIQFGHNDQRGKGPERETDPATTYAANLARYVDEVRAAGATPVLITSLTRRDFDSSHPAKIRSTLTPYVDAVRRIALEKYVPLIDLNSRSVALCEELGPEKTAALNPKKKDGTPDTTHLNEAGSIVFAGLIVDELVRVVPVLAPYLRRAPAP